MTKLDLSDPSGVIQAALQRALDLVSFGLRASDELEIQSLSLPGLQFQLTAAQSLSMSVDEARGEFRSWILANGIRDCVDAISPSLEWARKICFFWTREGEVVELDDGRLRISAQLTGQDWNTHIVEAAKDFDYWPLRKKLEHLEQEYDLEGPELSEAILSLSYARNCLTHRMGIVGQADLRRQSQSGLKVTWRKFKLIAKGVDGERELVIPAPVKAGEMISLGFSNVEKEFQLGDRVHFTPDEFVEIASTFLFFSLQIQRSIVDLQQSRKSEEQ